MTSQPEDVEQVTSTMMEILCPECGDRIHVADIRAFLLGLHERVCQELESVNGGPSGG